jgi:hypothetical protein
MPQTALERLVNWYASYCDGDWEHSYGVRIETLDNPGWDVEVDLVDTELAHLYIAFSRDERSETDWVQFSVIDGKFVGSGGVGNLEEVIEIFLKIAEGSANSAS